VPHGLHDATVDATIVRRWFTSWRDANVALATGSVADLWVLDVDPRHGGDDSLHDLECEHGSLPDTVRGLTGGGGRHLYFRMPAEGLGCVAGVRPGLDVKANGGYVLLPPSNHASGGGYTWEIGFDPRAIPVADAPTWLLTIARTRSVRAEQHDGRPLVLRNGERNDGLFRIASALRRLGIAEDAIRASIEAINRVHAVPPLEAAEIATIARSASRYHPSTDIRPRSYLRVPKP
jgi:hypothetical protein